MKTQAAHFLTLFLTIFLYIYLQARATEAKIKQLGLYKTKKLLLSEGNHQQNKKAAY